MLQTLSLNLRQLDRARVLSAAERFLNEEPVTVAAARSPRSAGGTHDFFSEGDYWWPDPAKPNGPYIQRDGMTNPDNFTAHRHAMIRFSIHTATLTAAFRLTNDLRFARHMLRHLAAWFVTPATRMNPNLQYAQAIQGITTGRGIGVIDTIHLIEVAQSALLLEASPEIAKAGLAKEISPVKSWFADYLHWLNTSKNGQDEKNAANNHGTCWVMQAASFASLTNDVQMLAECRQRFKTVLLPDQMAKDGSFPRELSRTKPYGYSLFNLDAMATICHISSTAKDNLWEFTLPDGRSMRKATAFLFPYIKNKAAWPHKPDVMFWAFWPVRSPALLLAGLAYNEPHYLDLWKTLDAQPTNDEVLRNLPLRQPLLWVE